MNLLPKRLTRKSKLWIRWGVSLLAVFAVLLLGYYLVVPRLTYSDSELKARITETLAESHIAIDFSPQIGRRLWWRPAIILHEVKIRGNEGARPFSVTADKVEIELSYSFLFKKLPIYRLRFVNPVAVLRPPPQETLPKDLKKAETKETKALLWPKYSEIKNGTLWLYEETDKKWRKVSRLTGTARALRAGQIWLDLKGEATWLNHPLAFSAKGPLLFTEEQLAADDFAFNFLLRSPHRLYQVLSKMNLRWDLKRHLLTLSKLNLFSKEYLHNITLEGLIPEVTYQKGELLVPKARLSLARAEPKREIQGFTDFARMACQNNRCRAESVNFGGNYDFLKRRFVVNGRGVLALDLAHKEGALNELTLNLKNIDDKGSISLWNFNLQGKVEAGKEKGLEVKLTGLLDNQPLSLALRHRGKGNPPWQGKINLASFDLRPYLEEDTHELLSTETIYNQVVGKIPLLVASLGDQKLSLDFTIQYLQLPLINLSAVSGAVSYRDQVLRLSSVTGKVFEGRFLTNVEYRHRPHPAWQVEHKLSQVNIGLMLFYLVNYPYLAGTGDAFFSFHTRGLELKEVLANLSGFSSLEIHDGNLLGYDWNQLLHSRLDFDDKAALPPHQISSNMAQNRFDLFKNITYWTKGVGETAALELKSPRFGVAGTGKTNLLTQALDFSLLLSGTVERGEEQTAVNLPLRIVGNLFDPEYYIDYKEMVRVLDDSADKERALKDFIKQQWQLLR